MAVELQREPELSDRRIDGLQRGFAMAAEIVIGVLQAELGMLQGIQGPLDFSVMFVSIGFLGADGGIHGHGHEETDGDAAGGNEFFHVVVLIYGVVVI